VIIIIDCFNNNQTLTRTLQLIGSPRKAGQAVMPAWLTQVRQGFCGLFCFPVEPHYGTIKRQWGFSYILTKKGMERASADVGLIFIVYNLRRIGNILTLNVLKEYLRILVSSFLGFFDLTGAVLMHLARGKYMIPGMADYKPESGYSVKFGLSWHIR